MTEVESLIQQRSILLNTLKEIATSKRTPSWISEMCKRGVMRAREVRVDKAPVEQVETATPQQTAANNATIEVGDLVYGNDAGDKCVYAVVRLSTTIDGMNLWDIQVVKGDAHDVVGNVHHNVPENKFHK